jgi:hypothetical protein
VRSGGVGLHYLVWDDSGALWPPLVAGLTVAGGGGVHHA